VLRNPLLIEHPPRGGGSGASGCMVRPVRAVMSSPARAAGEARHRSRLPLLRFHRGDGSRDIKRLGVAMQGLLMGGTLVLQQGIQVVIVAGPGWFRLWPKAHGQVGSASRYARRPRPAPGGMPGSDDRTATGPPNAACCDSVAS
jgi:hypothetical protein